MDNAGGFHRAATQQYPLGRLADIEPGVDRDVALAWESPYEVTGGEMTLRAEGTLRYWSEEDLEVEDPFALAAEDYACGWPQQAPSPLPRNYHLETGQAFPDAVLMDQCGEMVHLADFRGEWLVIDSTQPDCGPCQTMAEGAEGFVQEMGAEGYDVRVISLVGSGLAAPFESPDAGLLGDWAASFGLDDPVLADRGLGFALFPEYIQGDFGYPAWVIVDPSGDLVHGQVGFSSWAAVADVILNAR